jgi:hypothetical protein
MVRTACFAFGGRQKIHVGESMSMETGCSNRISSRIITYIDDFEKVFLRLFDLFEHIAPRALWHGLGLIGAWTVMRWVLGL